MPFSVNAIENPGGRIFRFDPSLAERHPHRIDIKTYFVNKGLQLQGRNTPPCNKICHIRFDRGLSNRCTGSALESVIFARTNAGSGQQILLIPIYDEACARNIRPLVYEEVHESDDAAPGRRVWQT